MCTKTKTSYGCGHVYKSTNDCYSSECPGVERCHVEKDWNCRDCKHESVASPRGREGKGRRIQRLNKSRERTASSVETTSEYNGNEGASPWAPQVKEEKTREGPHRRRADEAWLSEHEDRISDLQGRMERVKVSRGWSHSKPSQELILASEVGNWDDYDEQDADSILDTPTTKHIHMDIRRRLDDKPARTRSHRDQDRQHSHDSLPDSVPSYRSSPKIRKASTSHGVNPYPEATYEFDYYNNSTICTPPKHHRRHHSHHPGHSRSNTDPYLYRRSYEHPPNCEVAPSPPPPLQIPPAMYDTYEYYSPNASPSGALYPFSEYPYDVSYPSPLRPPHYVPYRRY